MTYELKWLFKLLNLRGCLRFWACFLICEMGMILSRWLVELLWRLSVLIWFRVFRSVWHIALNYNQLLFLRASHITQWKNNLPANAGDTGDMGLIPGSVRFPWRRKWQPTPVFCLENPMDRVAWWAMVHGAVKSRTGLSMQAERLFLERRGLFVGLAPQWP